MKIYHVIKIGISIGLLISLFYFAPISQIRPHIATYNWSWIFVSIVIGQLVMVMQARRWRNLAQGFQESPTLFEFYRLTSIGYLFNLILPSGIGGDAVKGYMLGKSYHGMGASYASVILTRIFGLAGLAICFWAGILFSSAELSGWLKILAVLTSFATVAPILAIKIPAFQKVLSASTRFLPIKFQGFFQTLVLQRLSNRQIASSFLDSALMQFLLILGQWCYFQAASVDVGFWELFVYLPIIFIATLLPISVFGIGIREWATILVFPTSIPQAQLLAATMVGYIVALFQAFQGAILLWVSKKKPA